MKQFQEYLAAGVALVPTGADKRPVVKWKEFQSRLPTVGELDQWLAGGGVAFAAVCGAVSGGLEIIDFDDNAGAAPLSYPATDIYEAWRDSCGRLVDALKLPVQRTGGGGFQVAYRCPAPEGNLKLAWVPDEGQATGRSISIETRGEGGYAIVAPSLHPSGNRYRMIAGSFAEIPLITQGDRDRLIHAARALDLMPYTMADLATVIPAKRTERRPMNGDISVIDAYNETHPIGEVLETFGYKRRSAGRYSRPGKDDSLGVAVLPAQNISFHWSSNDPLHKTNAAGRPVPMDPFDVYAYFEYRGDTKAAVKSAAGALGLQKAPRNGGGVASGINGHDAPEWATAPAVEGVGADPVDDGYLLAEGHHDEGTALCIYQRYNGGFLHSDALGWIYHNGTHWEMSEAEAKAGRAATETLIARMSAAAAAKENSETLRKFVPNASRVKGATSQLRTLVSVKAIDFDGDPDLLNCKNGVIDLRTGKIAPHSTRQRFLYCSPTVYDPNADQSKWIEWLIGAVGAEMADWLQMAIGYSITGHTKEEVMFYLFGPPRSGKGTFTETLLDMLGDPLGNVIGFHVLTAQREVDSQNFALAPLHTSRFIAASESNAYERFNEAKVKLITGGDQISVAFKHQTSFTYRPKYKIWLSSNQPVNADPDDEAVWGRIRVIEFPHSHLGKEDKGLKYDMRSPAILAGVLAWAVEGARRWYALGRKGLPELERARQTKSGHRAELDNVQAWIDETCERDEGFTSYASLYQSYQSWCKDRGVEPKKQKGFSQSLIMKGYKNKLAKVQGKMIRGFNGLRIL